MYKFLIFAGTTEGRVLSEELAKFKAKLHICVATDYGKSLLSENEDVKVEAKRLNIDEMTNLMVQGNFDAVIDATHPYAIEVTANIKEACARCDKEYIRLLREGKEYNSKSVVYVKNMNEAVEYLNSVKGNILLTTGSKDLKIFTNVNDYEKRIFPRILPMVDVLKSCFDLGYLGKNIICMQGPFSEELNLATLKKVEGKHLVTKESGDIGGIEEKIRAAEAVGGKVVLVARPTCEEGLSLDEVVSSLVRRFDLQSK